MIADQPLEPNEEIELKLALPAEQMDRLADQSACVCLCHRGISYDGDLGA